MKVLMSVIISMFLISCGQDEAETEAKDNRSAQTDESTIDELQEGFGIKSLEIFAKTIIRKAAKLANQYEGECDPFRRQIKTHRKKVNRLPEERRDAVNKKINDIISEFKEEHDC